MLSSLLQRLQTQKPELQTLVGEPKTLNGTLPPKLHSQRPIQLVTTRFFSKVYPQGSVLNLLDPSVEGLIQHPFLNPKNKK